MTGQQGWEAVWFENVLRNDYGASQNTSNANRVSKRASQNLGGKVEVKSGPSSPSPHPPRCRFYNHTSTHPGFRGPPFPGRKMPATILGSCVLKWNPPGYKYRKKPLQCWPRLSPFSQCVPFCSLVRSFSPNCLALPPPPPPSRYKNPTNGKKTRRPRGAAGSSQSQRLPERGA